MYKPSGTKALLLSLPSQVSLTLPVPVNVLIQMVPVVFLMVKFQLTVLSSLMVELKTFVSWVPMLAVGEITVFEATRGVAVGTESRVRSSSCSNRNRTLGD